MTVRWPRRSRACACVAVAAAALAAAGNAAAGSRIYPVWCGDWDANPVANVAAAQVTTGPTRILSDGSTGEIQWGSSGGHEYAWARLVNDPTGGDTIALYWVDNANRAIYQCGDSHGYVDATVWPRATETWTAGVPVDVSPGPGGAVAIGYLAWSRSGALQYESPLYNAPPVSPAPQPAPSPPVSAPPAPPSGSAHVTLHGSRRSVHNGQVVRFVGQAVSPSLSHGTLIELQGSVAKRPRHWITFKYVATSASGRFKAFYRFHDTTGRQTYALRAQLPAQLGDGFRQTTSRPILIRVTG